MGFVSERFLLMDPPFYSHACEFHKQNAYTYGIFALYHKGTREREWRSSSEILSRLLTNSLATSPLAFAAKIKAFAANSRQLRRLAIGSYTRLLRAGCFFFSKGHLDECSPRIFKAKQTASSLESYIFESDIRSCDLF